MQTPVAVAQIEVVKVGVMRRMILPALDRIELLRLWHVDRTQHQRIQYAKDDGVCADAQCQR